MITFDIVTINWKDNTTDIEKLLNKNMNTLIELFVKQINSLFVLFVEIMSYLQSVKAKSFALHQERRRKEQMRQFYEMRNQLVAYDSIFEMNIML